jgi:hypothetical protein
VGTSCAESLAFAALTICRAESKLVLKKKGKEEEKWYIRLMAVMLTI